MPPHAPPARGPPSSSPSRSTSPISRTCSGKSRRNPPPASGRSGRKTPRSGNRPGSWGGAAPSWTCSWGWERWPTPTPPSCCWGSAAWGRSSSPAASTSFGPPTARSWRSTPPPSRGTCRRRRCSASRRGRSPGRRRPAKGNWRLPRGEASSRAAGKGVLETGVERNPEVPGARRRGDQPGPAADGHRREVPGGPLRPVERFPDPRAPPLGEAGGHPPSRGFLPPEVLRDSLPPPPVLFERGAGGGCGPQLERKCPGTGKLRAETGRPCHGKTPAAGRGGAGTGQGGRCAGPLHGTAGAGHRGADPGVRGPAGGSDRERGRPPRLFSPADGEAADQDRHGGGRRKPEEGRGDPGNQPEHPAEKTDLPLPPAPEKEVPIRGDWELRAPKLIAEGAGAVFLPAIAISGISRQNVREVNRAGSSGFPVILAVECRGFPGRSPRGSGPARVPGGSSPIRT